MESFDHFTFRNSRIRAWLAGTCAVVVLVAVIFPPAFWLCGLGAPLVVVAVLAHSARTGQWYTWQRWEPSFSWFEGWAGATGATMILGPVLTITVRAWLA
jgi:hypothetical protein